MARGLETLTLKVAIVAWTNISGIRLVVVNDRNQSATQNFPGDYTYCWFNWI